jgi:cytidylate kinase
MTAPGKSSIRTVTISASYGAAGSVVGPAVAEALRMAFLDRAIPMSVAERLSVPLDDALSHDEQVASGFWRGLAYTAMPTLYESGVTAPAVMSDETFRQQTELVLRNLADTTGGVILGRGAQFVLADRADVLKVRLDGPVERRIAQAVAGGEGDDATVRRTQRTLDRTRDAYVKRFYRKDPTEAAHYDLVIDSTVIRWELCVEVIVAATGLNRH